MKTTEEIKKIALGVISAEIAALQAMMDRIDAEISRAVEMIFHSEGKVVVTGVGKSAIIGQKIVATLNSTGTTAVFMHAGDAIHGDLGIINEEDVLLLLSKSGETPEIKVLIPLLKARQNKLISIVGNTASYLAEQADVVIDATVPRKHAQTTWPQPPALPRSW